MLTEVENRIVICPVTKEVLDWMDCSKFGDENCERCMLSLNLYQRE